MTKRTFVIAIAIVILGSLTYVGAQQKAVRAYGSFDNVRISGEHASGYSLDLWTEGTKMIGLIRIHRGLIGDPPAGLLDDIVYDARSGKLSFTTKASLGLFSDASHDKVPSQDVLRFAGKVSKTRVTGVIHSENLLCKDKCKERRTITLRTRPAGDLQNYVDRAAWKKDVDEILKQYGPTW